MPLLRNGNAPIVHLHGVLGIECPVAMTRKLSDYGHCGNGEERFGTACVTSNQSGRGRVRSLGQTDFTFSRQGYEPISSCGDLVRVQR
jgi:hypothetical protein